jgi:hypothetical protein
MTVTKIKYAQIESPALRGFFYDPKVKFVYDKKSKFDLFVMLIEEMIFRKMVIRVLFDMDFLPILKAPFPLLRLEEPSFGQVGK